MMRGYEFPEHDLSQYLSRHAAVTHNISHSDCEALTLAELLQRADTESRRLWDRLTLAYTEYEGHPILREEIAALYTTIKPQHVNVVIVHEGIMLTCKALVDQARSELDKGVEPEAITMYPGFKSLSVEPKAFGCDVTQWRGTHTSERGWHYDVSDLEHVVTDRTKILVINTPHNPTGWGPTLQEANQIVSFCKKHDLYLFCDEVYSMLPRHDGLEPLPSFSDLYDKAVILNGLSKTMRCPGIRIGWVVTRNKAIYDRIARFKDYTTVCSSAPSEILGIIAMRAKDLILGEVHSLVQENMACAEQLFAKEFPDLFDFHRPLAGTITCVKIKGALLTKYSTASQLAAELRETVGLVIIPGAVVNTPEDDCFRLGFGRKQFSEAIDAFRTFLTQHGNFKKQQD